MPKSSSLTVPSAVTSTFDGFRSRCTTSRACAYSTASITCGMSSSRCVDAGALLAAPLGDRLAVDVFQREIRPAVGGESGVVERGDVRMVEARQDVALAREALAHCAREQVYVRQLERDLALELAVRRAARARPRPCRPCRSRARGDRRRSSTPACTSSSGARSIRGRSRYSGAVAALACPSTRRSHAPRFRIAGTPARPASPCARAVRQLQRLVEQAREFRPAVARERRVGHGWAVRMPSEGSGVRRGRRVTGPACPAAAGAPCPSRARRCAQFTSRISAISGSESPPK